MNQKKNLREVPTHMMYEYLQGSTLQGVSQRRDCFKVIITKKEKERL